MTLRSLVFTFILLFHFTNPFSVYSERYPYFENNKTIDKSIKKKLRPYILPEKHPLRIKLSNIFNQVRATQNIEAFTAAGFNVISIGPRSFVHVAVNDSLPGYIFKAYMDTELRKKKGRPGWHWLVQRCKGAAQVRQAIKDHDVTRFTVAKKWIFPLPARPRPPLDLHHTCHVAILAATDMQLTSMRDNLHAWKTVITKEHLKELYKIISQAKGSSYRPDNIWYTVHGTFAFIDTEYPAQTPDYVSIRKHLAPEMQEYWDKLVDKGV